MPGTDGWGTVPGFWRGCAIARWCDPSGLLTVANDDGGLTVVGYKGSDPVGALEIPAEIGGVPVTMIGEEAFKNMFSLDAVTIPASVTNIGEFAFVGDYRLALLDFVGNAPEVGGIGLGLYGEDKLVRVRPDTMGWGEVPGIWQGLPTVYDQAALAGAKTVARKLSFAPRATLNSTLTTLEGTLRIVALVPSATPGAFEISVMASVGDDAVKMSVEEVAKSIYVGSSLSGDMVPAKILVRPTADATTLTFTVANPDETATSSFFRIKVAE